MADHTIEELKKIIEQREEWAKVAREKDLHGSAREWDLTASLARQLIELKEASNQKESTNGYQNSNQT